MLRLTAHAKVNLALHVTGRREDGYHFLDSLVVFTEFGDEVAVAPAEEDRVLVDGPFAAILAGTPGDNIIIRARNALRTRVEDGGQAAPPVELRLTKRLPVAAGIGGGSADAAATLRLLARHWKATVSSRQLQALALTLGADVPMCLGEGPVKVRGIGEATMPVAGLGSYWLVLANPGVPVATSAVFARLASIDNEPLPSLTSRVGTDATTLAEWLRGTRNDLAAPASLLAAEIGSCVEELEAEGALLARMSGSGATCFGLYGTREEAHAAASAIAARQPTLFLQATRTLPAETF